VTIIGTYFNMNVSFIDFWSNFDNKNNLLLDVLQNCFHNVNVVEPKNADVIFYSLFGKEHLLYKDTKKIFYTGEAVHWDTKKIIYPENEESFASLSFSYGTGKNNLRFPIWYFYIDWFNKKTYRNPQWLVPEKYLYNINNDFVNTGTNFCAAIYSNQLKTRKTIVKSISKYKEVDCYGRVENFKKLEGNEKEKVQLLLKYKFSLAMENTLLNGYHTEKLIHAKIAGTIPIYYGSNTVINEFNKNAFIVFDYYKKRKSLNKIIEIDNDKTLFNEIKKQPLLLEKISFDNVYKFFVKVL